MPSLADTRGIGGTGARLSSGNELVLLTVTAYTTNFTESYYGRPME